MDRTGYRKVITALNGLGPGRHRSASIEVIPEPLGEEKVRWITIVGYGGKLAPSTALNALGRAGLIERTDGTAAKGPPCLRPIGMQLGSVTLEDTAYVDLPP